MIAIEINSVAAHETLVSVRFLNCNFIDHCFIFASRKIINYGFNNHVEIRSSMGMLMLNGSFCECIELAQR